jgi:hypothetical protein
LFSGFLDVERDAEALPGGRRRGFEDEEFEGALELVEGGAGHGAAVEI